ncbi:MAG: hypothetical protein ACYTJ0_12765 [Planctomycetota bacterium]|jgi:hypothetical protein
MMSLPNILTLACIATVGGVVTLGHTVLQDDHQAGKVKAFLHGVRDRAADISHGMMPSRMQVFGAAAETDTSLDYAARRYREIYADAVASAPDDDVLDVEASEKRVIPLRSSDFYLSRRQAQSRAITSNRARSVFDRSRRANTLSAQGRYYPRAGSTGYYRSSRDDRPISPTGRSSIFQRSRFAGTTQSRYSYSSNGRVRRVPRRIR